MTIAAAYLTSEGVVLGADSAASVTVPTPGGLAISQILTHTQKVFEVIPKEPGLRGRMAVATWGAGVYAKGSHRTLVASLGTSLPYETPVQEAANTLLSMIPDYNPGAAVGYFIGGVDIPSRAPSCYQVEFVPGQPVAPPQALQIGQATFGPCAEYFSRIFYGFDYRLPGMISTQLQATRPQDPSLASDCQQVFINAASQLGLRTVTDLSIREAIDFVFFFLYATIKGYKFSGSAPVCGGPVEIGFVTTDKPFRWAWHKSFISAIDESLALEGRRWSDGLELFFPLGPQQDNKRV